MKQTSKQLKALSRESLQRRWGTPVGAAALYILIIYAITLLTQLLLRDITIINQIILLLIQLLFSFLYAGYIYLILNMARGSSYRLSDLFAGFRLNPDRFIIANSIKMLLFLPFFILSWCYQGTGQLLFVLSAYVWLVIAEIINIGFCLTNYLLIDDQQLGAISSLSKSWTLMHGNRWRYFYIRISFFGFSLIGIASCGIGLLWIMPYMEMTLAYFYRNIIGEI